MDDCVQACWQCAHSCSEMARSLDIAQPVMGSQEGQSARSLT
jgi:hypothetical protein